MDTLTLLTNYLDRYSFTLIRYFAIASALFLILQFGSRFFRKIPNRKPNQRQIGREIFHSVKSLTFYSSLFFILYFLKTQFGYSPMYTDIAQYGWGYFVFSIILLIVIGDTVFYWAHRFMHLPKYYKSTHALHHEFINPTAFAGYGFDIREAMINAIGTYFIPVLIVPWHPLAMLIFTTTGIFWVLYIHSGFEIFPQSWFGRPWFSWVYTSTHHNLHHQYPGSNFGVYFTFWDKLMGTEELGRVIPACAPAPALTAQSTHS